MSLLITKFAIGQVLDLSIDSLSFNGGRGVGRYEGMVIFVPWTVPGDQIRVRITELKKSFLIADLIEILKPAAARRIAPCPVFGRCGGCSWQNVDYEEQIRQKQKILTSSLRALQSKDVEVKPFVPSPKEFDYRNRIQVNKIGEQVGFFERGSRVIVNIDHCPISEPDVSEQIKAVRLRPDARYEISRRTDGTVAVDSEIRHPEASLFSQVNSAQNENVIAAILNAAREKSFEQVWDLYCGAGNLTFPLASAFPSAKVQGVELSHEAIVRAKAIPSQVKWSASDVAEFLVGQKNQKSLLVVLDPPRVGAEDRVLSELVRLQPETILYLSCNPMTFSRDVQKLTRSHYRLKSVQGFDMFPQTEHVEILGLIERR